MTDERVHKGLAHVRPRPGAGFAPGVLGAYVTVLVLGRDEAHLAEVVAEAMDDHDCGLLEVDLELLDEALEENAELDAWREIALDLTETKRVWCKGTFHTYSNEDDVE